MVCSGFTQVFLSARRVLRLSGGLYGVSGVLYNHQQQTHRLRGFPQGRKVKGHGFAPLALSAAICPGRAGDCQLPGIPVIFQLIFSCAGSDRRFSFPIVHHHNHLFGIVLSSPPASSPPTTGCGSGGRIRRGGHHQSAQRPSPPVPARNKVAAAPPACTRYGCRVAPKYRG